MTAEKAVMLVKKVTYFGKFGYLNSSCIRKRIILMFLSSSREQFTLLKQNSVTAVSVGFRPPPRCPSRFGTDLHHQYGISGRESQTSLFAILT